MRRILFASLVVAAFLWGCGGGDGGGGAGGGGAGGGAGGGGGGAALPGGAIVIFGTAYDPTSFTVTGVTTAAKVGSPIVAVGRIFTPRPASEINVRVSSGSAQRPDRPPTASNNPENADLFAVDLTADALTPGTWIVSFLAPNGRIVASGFLSITP